MQARVGLEIFTMANFNPRRFSFLSGIEATPGTRAANLFAMPVAVADDLEVDVVRRGTEQYSSNSRWNFNSYDYVDLVAGGGSFTIPATPDALAYWLTVAGCDPTISELVEDEAYQWEFVPGESDSKSFSLVCPKGSSTLTDDMQYLGCTLTRLAHTFGADQKAGRLTIGFTSIRPAQYVRRADMPTATATFETMPIAFTEGADSWQMTGVNGGNPTNVFNSFEWEMTFGVDEYQGGTEYLYANVQTVSDVMFTTTALFDSSTKPLDLKERFGVLTEPTTGTTPGANGLPYGEFSVDFARGSGATARGISYEVPNALLDITSRPTGNTGGGAATLTVVGMPKSADGVTDEFVITCTNGRADAFAAS